MNWVCKQLDAFLFDTFNNQREVMNLLSQVIPISCGACCGLAISCWSMAIVTWRELSNT